MKKGCFFSMSKSFSIGSALYFAFQPKVRYLAKIHFISSNGILNIRLISFSVNISSKHFVSLVTIYFLLEVFTKVWAINAPNNGFCF